MYISYNWLKEFIDFSFTPAELDHILTMLGIEVESIIDYREKYKNFYIAQVLTKEKHPNADKLSVCTVNYGFGVNTVVCGAPNVEAGQKVVLGLPGAVVPANGITLDKRAIRKVESAGMICSQTELELGSDASGIWVLPEDARPGQPLAEYLNLNDVVFDISVTPNRPDCLSHLGIAREIAAYSGNKLRIPEIKTNETGAEIVQDVKVIIESPELCPRYTARAVRNVTIQESPAWLKNRLTLLGFRPINIAVDVTNYILIECGQPLHAFDLDELAGHTIVVRIAGEGEKFTTLDSKERILDGNMLMICDAEKPVAVGGVMGGENSEIKDTTKNILIESAYFTPSSIRRTAKKLGISSESSYRFERGVDIDNVTYALDRAAQLIMENSGGESDKGRIDAYPIKREKLKLTLRYERAEKIIGTAIPKEKVKDMLKALYFNIISDNDESVTVEVPSFRVDIYSEIDLIEEVAILNNYDNLDPQFVSSLDFNSEGTAEILTLPPLRGKLRNYFVQRGFHEILTQNMLDPKSAAIYEQNPVHIANPLGEELSIMRPSLVPAILRTIERNLRVGNANLQIFETGKTFHRVVETEETFIAGYKEQEELIIAITGKSAPKQWSVPERNVDFYDIKGIMEELEEFFRFKNLIFTENTTESVTFSKNSLNISSDNKIIGTFGEVSPELLKTFDIETNVYIANINLNELYKAPRESAHYEPVAPYPGSSRDLAFIVETGINARDIKNVIMENGGALLKNVGIFDVYAGKSIGEGRKSIAYSLYFASEERTLTDAEVDAALNKIIPAVENKFNAELRK